LEEEFSYTVKELIRNPSFIRWTRGKAKKKETSFWDQWIKKSEENRKMSRKAQQRLTGLGFSDSPLPDIEEEWQQVRGKLKAESNKKEIFEFNHYKLPVAQHSLYRYLKVAAIIAFVFGASWFLVMNIPLSLNTSKKAQIQTITTRYMEQKTLTLPDGSKITLAAGSELSHAEDWLQQPTKHVTLKGEAYFSIVPLKVKDHAKLVVQTPDGTVSDWGTQFTVSTYGKSTQVVLQEGEVRLNVAGGSDQKPVMMKPGELADFKKADQHVAIRHVNPLVYTSWASKRLVFDNTPLSLLVKRIKHTYGVQVQVENKALLTKKLSGSVDFRSLDMLIHAVNQVLDIKISRKGNTVYIRNDK
jgi:ferric-dicitrate binding protein FerR (iron transport regulator)